PGIHVEVHVFFRANPDLSGSRPGDLLPCVHTRRSTDLRSGGRYLLRQLYVASLDKRELFHRQRWDWHPLVRGRPDHHYADHLCFRTDRDRSQLFGGDQLPCDDQRSDKHTSSVQSREQLVCRLTRLEKKELF